MSSTYVSGYAALAFKVASGYAYVAFHETCESNCFPQVPRWSAHYIGTLAQIGASTVEYVYCCDSGMTRGARGRSIKAETFIERAENAVREAPLFSSSIEIRFGADYRAVKSELLGTFDALAHQLGVLVQSPSQNTRRLDLVDPEAGELLLQFSRLPDVYPGQLFSRDEVRTVGDRRQEKPWGTSRLTRLELAAEREAAKSFLDKYRLVKLMFGDGGGYWDSQQAVFDLRGNYVTGSPMQWFCGGYLKERNSQRFGASLPMLSAFRAWEKQEALTTDMRSTPSDVRLLNPEATDEYVLKPARKLAGDQPLGGWFRVRDVDALRDVAHGMLEHNFALSVPALSTGSETFSLV